MPYTSLYNNQSNVWQLRVLHYYQTNSPTKSSSMGQNSADDCTHIWWSAKKINEGVSTILLDKKVDYNLLSSTGIFTLSTKYQ